MRVSRKGDREGESFISPDEQRSAIEGWAAHNNAVIVSWADETDSVSGKTTNRKGLKAAMNEAVSGRSDGVIVARVDRFSRNLAEGLTAIKSLHDAGKHFVAVHDGINGNTSRGTGKFLLTMLLMFAEWQWESSADYWETTKRNHIGRGAATNYPYGYRKDPETKQLVPYEPEAKEVRFIFEKRAAGWSWQEIAGDLNRRKVPTAERPLRKHAQPGEVPRGRRANVWVNMMLPSIVARRTYLGELQSGPHINLKAHPPIVTKKMWDAAHAMKKTPPKKGRDAYLLTGMVRCASCGGRMTGLTENNGRGGVYYRYRCRHFYSFGTCPAPARAYAVELEETISDLFVAKYLSGESVAGEPSTDELDAALEALAEAEADLDAFTSSESTRRMGRTLGQVYIDRGVDERTDAVVAAQEAVATARAAVHGASLPENAARIWDNPKTTTEERRTLLSSVISVIAVTAAPKGSRASNDGRIDVWMRGEPGEPTDLPTRGGANQLRPIARRR